MIQISFETIPLVAKHNSNIKIKSNNTNKIVTKNNNFEGKTISEIDQLENTVLPQAI